ncbi:anthranilate synthase component I family protein [Nocardia vaccinii]|uniref:anthranilate synthase component I family protein n=1 Tax=Nocardia vaccinii TaxID=1822 RepID=UPI00082ADCBE|nr:anthranilate synthase component I family protein [Nocardia vaccinii]
MAGPDAAAEYFREIAELHDRCFWLDGAAGSEWSGLRSYIGWLEPDDVSLSYGARSGVVHRHQGNQSEEVGTDIFDVLDRELRNGRSDAQWFGYLGYAARPDLTARPSEDLPDAVWMCPSHVRVFTHPSVATTGPCAVVAHPAEPNRERSYREAFARVQDELHSGNTYEVNLTYRVRVLCDRSPVSTYLELRRRNPAPYAGFLQHDVPEARAWLLSSSPERFVTVDDQRWAESRPIKGTTPRGATDNDDEYLRSRLAHDPSFRSENLMIVDLLRNDLGMVSEPGSVSTPGLMEVESYASVHQLVSTVRGRLREDISTVGAIRAMFPPGSMTGAPKRRTMQIIDEVEDSPRGVYSGAFGRISTSGEADLGVVIRSLVTDGSGCWTFGTGGGITVCSQVESELAETRFKATRLLDVLHSAESSADEIDRRLEVGHPVGH